MITSHPWSLRTVRAASPLLNQWEGRPQKHSAQRLPGLQALPRNHRHCRCSTSGLCTVLAKTATTKNCRCLCQSPLRRRTIGTCKTHGETAKARETPKRFQFDQCGQQGCNFCESSIWGSWNLPAGKALTSCNFHGGQEWGSRNLQAPQGSWGNLQIQFDTNLVLVEIRQASPENKPRLLTLTALSLLEAGARSPAEVTLPAECLNGNHLCWESKSHSWLWIYSMNFPRDPTAASSTRCLKDTANVVPMQINLHR